jgi:hypothetical protein
LKPERQLVLPAPEPARLLPTEVKEVFSYVLPSLNFPVICVFAEGLKTPGTELTGAHENHASSLLFDSDIDARAVPSLRKSEGKSDLSG